MQDIKINVNPFQGEFVKNILNIVSLFFLSFASSLLGYSVYLFLEAFSFIEKEYSSWSGEALMWSLILFFAALFLLFIPLELKLIKKDNSADFQNVIGRILITVILSILILFLSSALFAGRNAIMQNIYLILRAYAFSGLVFVNIGTFLIWWASSKLEILDRYSFTLTGTIWILGTLIFI
tara:strand:+ start:4356 stop:4895 length:540 start_codon:yes stop_codon:yes gene_type:complete